MDSSLSLSLSNECNQWWSVIVINGISSLMSLFIDPEAMIHGMSGFWKWRVLFPFLLSSQFLNVFREWPERKREKEKERRRERKKRGKEGLKKRENRKKKKRRKSYLSLKDSNPPDLINPSFTSFLFLRIWRWIEKANRKKMAERKKEIHRFLAHLILFSFFLLHGWREEREEKQQYWDGKKNEKFKGNEHETRNISGFLPLFLLSPLCLTSFPSSFLLCQSEREREREREFKKRRREITIRRLEWQLNVRENETDLISKVNLNHGNQNERERER